MLVVVLNWMEMSFLHPNHLSYLPQNFLYWMVFHSGRWRIEIPDKSNCNSVVRLRRHIRGFFLSNAQRHHANICIANIYLADGHAFKI